MYGFLPDVVPRIFYQSEGEERSRILGKSEKSLIEKRRQSELTYKSSTDGE